MRHRGRSQPRIADRHLRKLYWIAKRQRVKLTQLLNLIIATALEELAQAPDLSDGGHITSATGHSRAQQRHPEQGFHQGTKVPSQASDRHRLPRADTRRHHHHHNAVQR